MSYIISEEQLKHYVDLSKDDPQCYEYALEMQQIIHSRPLPEALKQQPTKTFSKTKLLEWVRQYEEYLCDFLPEQLRLPKLDLLSELRQTIEAGDFDE